MKNSSYTKKRGATLLPAIIFIILVLAVGAGAVYYFCYRPPSSTESSTPPVLNLGSNSSSLLFKGQMLGFDPMLQLPVILLTSNKGKTDQALEKDAENIKKNLQETYGKYAVSDSYVTIKGEQKLSYFYSLKDVSIGEIVNAIKRPASTSASDVATNSILVVYYDKSKGFTAIYPDGGDIPGKEILKESGINFRQGDDEKIQAYNGFIVWALKPTKLYLPYVRDAMYDYESDLRKVVNEAPLKTSLFEPSNFKNSGWHLIGFDTSNELCSFINDSYFKDHIVSIFFMDNDRGKIVFSSIKASELRRGCDKDFTIETVIPKYHLFWFDIGIPILEPDNCTGWTYSEWGECLAGSQDRVAYKIPSGCTGEPDVEKESLTKSCETGGDITVGPYVKCISDSNCIVHYDDCEQICDCPPGISGCNSCTVSPFCDYDLGFDVGIAVEPLEECIKNPNSCFSSFEGSSFFKVPVEVFDWENYRKELNKELFASEGPVLELLRNDLTKNSTNETKNFSDRLILDLDDKVFNADTERLTEKFMTGVMVNSIDSYDNTRDISFRAISYANDMWKGFDEIHDMANGNDTKLSSNLTKQFSQKESTESFSYGVYHVMFDYAAKAFNLSNFSGTSTLEFLNTNSAKFNTLNTFDINTTKGMQLP